MNMKSGLGYNAKKQLTKQFFSFGTALPRRSLVSKEILDLEYGKYGI